MSDSLTVFGTDYTGVTGIKAKGTGNGTLTYIRPSGTKSITENGTGIDVAAYASVDVSVSGGGTPSLQAKTATPSESTQTIEPDSGYDGLSSVEVGAISSTYVGSGVTQRTSSDLTASGATVTVPAGHYAAQASKAVASGTEGTPTASKGSVSNHSVTVTPSVTNSAGYIAGGTHSGTAVSVAASELVSGTVTISGSGTTDVTNYASASVASGGATASATKGAVSNHSVTVTPSVTRTAGWVTAGSSNGTAVTVSASELVSGSETKTANGTYDVTNLAELVVNVASSGASIDTKTVTASNYPTSISFSSMEGQPKAFFLRSTSQISSSGSTTYYYIISMVYDGTDTTGSCFRIGSTRRVDPVASGYSWSYSGTTLTLRTSAGSRSSSPGAFNNGYQLVYVY